ncbi:3-oxoacyl-[acyl-carrier-protein] synthase III C-terminal domain-containing protein [Mycobacterium sp. GA-2829]|uniref:3-oxoacyl-[acyl-carrier-protein] synthase III C-terminal domain-containing protein n=1 Tax=Mycobacterium sp. GA-2829 TaxID=1772283 RepID=UPI00073FFDD0|nr:3-oxoacyl-[acyl-carrier-protein] synthase III C-terminal domain-containing protein [Mycobacterium sp. GA-2829]KUI32630.1 3-oxoacyl-ACP synthase [Mycobacterium sp. GA-2829]
MGTVIDRAAVVHGGWRHRHSALQLAVEAGRDCLAAADQRTDDVSLLINAGIYRDRNLGEPALAALIQDELGVHPEDPHPRDHGAFSFDVANGTCGVLTALQIADAWLRSGSITESLIVASDADPGRGRSRAFPYAPVGGALLCRWSAMDPGLRQPQWVTVADTADIVHSEVGFTGMRNVLRFGQARDVDDTFADAAAQAVRKCLAVADVALEDVGWLIAAPARPGFRAALADRLGIDAQRIRTAPDDHTHTAALIAAYRNADTRFEPARPMLLVAAGAGVTAGAALYG